MADAYVVIDPMAVNYLVNEPEGPVGALIAEVSLKATAIAKADAPIMKKRNYSFWRPTWNPETQYGPPGHMKSSVHWSGFRFNKLGQMYSGVNTDFAPTVFLEHPARQIKTTEYRYMTHALEQVQM